MANSTLKDTTGKTHRSDRNVYLNARSVFFAKLKVAEATTESISVKVLN